VHHEWPRLYWPNVEISSKDGCAAVETSAEPEPRYSQSPVDADEFLSFDGELSGL
jgi:hypothetical protein